MSEERIGLWVTIACKNGGFGVICAKNKFLSVRVPPESVVLSTYHPLSDSEASELALALEIHSPKHFFFF